MQPSDYYLGKMGNVWVEGLPVDRLRLVLRQTLNDLKEAWDRLNMTSENSFRRADSMASWDRFGPMQEPSGDGVESALDKCTKTNTWDKDDPPDSGAGLGETSRKRGSGKPPGKPPGAQDFGRTQKRPVYSTLLQISAQCPACAMVISHGKRSAERTRACALTSVIETWRLRAAFP